MKKTEEIQRLTRHLKRQIKIWQDELYGSVHTYRYRSTKRKIKKYEKWVKALEN